MLELAVVAAGAAAVLLLVLLLLCLNLLLRLLLLLLHCVAIVFSLNKKVGLVYLWCAPRTSI
jgi:hypothetical protein